MNGDTPLTRCDDSWGGRDSFILVDVMLRIISEGWKPYHGTVEDYVYDELMCMDKKFARWFTHDTKPFLCFGCMMGCIWNRDEGGFQLTRHSNSLKTLLAFESLPMVSAGKLLDVKKVLRINEAAWVLNISPRTVRCYVDEGRLTALAEKPFRVTSESVRRQLEMIRPG